MLNFLFYCSCVRVGFKVSAVFMVCFVAYLDDSRWYIVVQHISFVVVTISTQWRMRKIMWVYTFGPYFTRLCKRSDRGNIMKNDKFFIFIPSSLYSLKIKLDFHTLCLWEDPDLTDVYYSLLPSNMRAVTMSHLLRKFTPFMFSITQFPV